MGDKFLISLGQNMYQLGFHFLLHEKVYKEISEHWEVLLADKSHFQQQDRKQGSEPPTKRITFKNHCIVSRSLSQVLKLLLKTKMYFSCLFVKHYITCETLNTLKIQRIVCWVLNVLCSMFTILTRFLTVVHLV